MITFIKDVYRVGKSTELVSFVLWEVQHRLRWFSGNYIKFTSHSFLAINPQDSYAAVQAITTDFLAERGVCFKAVAVDWKYCIPINTHEVWGCRHTNPQGLYYSADDSASCTLVYTFPAPITSLFISKVGYFFVCAGGTIYKSGNNGISFQPVLQLSTSISYFLFNNGMTELPDQTLIIGEYGSIWSGKKWQNLSFLYYSIDEGNSWIKSDFLIRQGINKHIHLVKYSPRLRAAFLTDGDNKKKLWVNQQAAKSLESWSLINKYHYQTGGYTSMAETDEITLFGSDYLGGTNFIIATRDGANFRKRTIPDPYRRSPVMNMVVRVADSGKEIWAASFSCLSTKAKSVLMCTTDAGQTWARDFDGTKNEVSIISGADNNLSTTLYISISEFDNQQSQHHYRIFKLQPARSI